MKRFTALDLRTFRLRAVVAVGIAALGGISMAQAATLTMSPTAPVVATNGTDELHVEFDSDGAGPNVPSFQQDAAWSSSNTNVVTVSSAGMLTGVSPGGTATVTAIYQGLTATASVTVAGTVTTYSFTTPDNRSRKYLLYVPAGLGSGPVPLVLNFHGGGANSQLQLGTSQLNVQAHASKFLIAYARGNAGIDIGIYTWNGGNCCGYAETNEVDDVVYASMVIDDVQSRFNVDANRVFATGFSNGAHMSHRVGCQLSSRIAAAAPASGGMVSETLVGGTSDPNDNFENCAPVRRVPVMHFNGTTDLNSLYTGGTNGNGNATACVWTDEGACSGGLGNTIDTWLAVNSLTGITPTITYSFGIETCRTWAVNADEVTLCKARPSVPNEVGGVVYDGGGHAWPTGVRWNGSADLPTNDLNASAHLWTFFAAHPMTGAGAQVAFSDGFESGNFTAGGWVTSGTPTVSTAAKNTGVYGARINGTSSITKTVSTVGKSAVKLSYDRRTSGLDTGENLYVEYSIDGATWTLAEAISTQISFANKSLTLRIGTGGQAPTGNQPALRIRFRTNANLTSEYADIDNVVVTIQ